MLRLEKTSDLSGIAIRFREKERFFETRVLKALICALLIHLTTFILFRIANPLLISNFVFSPVQMRFESLEKNNLSEVTSYFDEDEFKFEFFGNEMSERLDWLAFLEPSLLFPATFDFNSLENLEKEFWPKLDLPLSIELTEPYIKMMISGDLANFILIKSDPILSSMQPFSTSLDIYSTSYEIQMDGNTGEIFWFQQKSSSGDKKIDQMIEKVILSLRFNQSEKDEFINGYLNFDILKNISQND